MIGEEFLIQRARTDTNRRWWVIVGILVIIIVSNQNKNIAEFWPVLTVIGFSALYNFVLFILAHNRQVSRFWAYFEILLDIILIGGLIHFNTGIISSPFFFLFPVMILIQTFHRNTAEIIVTGAGILICSVFLYYLAPRPESVLFVFLDRLIIIIGITSVAGILVSVLNREQRRLTSILEEQKQHLEEANRTSEKLQIKIRSSTRKLEAANVTLVKKNLAMLAMHEIYFAMSSTVNTSRLLNMVLDTACSLLKAKSGYLMLLHNQHLQVKVGRGLDAKRLAALKFKVGRGIEGRVVQTGKARMIGDLSAVDDPALISEDSKSKMCVPLRVHKKIVGIIALESPKLDAFNRNDLELFTMLGSQASEVLQTIELYKEMRNKADRLSLLFEVGQDIGTVFNLNRLFSTILERARQVMKAKRGSLMIYEKERNMLGIRASFGLALGDEQNRISIEQGIAGWVFKNVRSVLIPAVENSQLYNKEKDQVYAGRNLVACPLRIRKKVFGVICINDRSGSKKFTRDDLDLLNALATQAAIAIENVELYARLRRDYLNAIKALAAAVDAKDHYTHGHSNKVMAYATMIARELGLNEKEIEKIKFSALLHDVGKIGISEVVLNKPSGLTAREFDIIAMHPILGVSIVQNIESLKDLIPIILHHHERYGGGGYPEGRFGNSIPLGARIVSVADAWDVMTSERAYRRALPKEVAIAELERCSGEQFDPEIVGVFLRALKKGYKENVFKIEEESQDLIWDEDEINRLMG